MLERRWGSVLGAGVAIACAACATTAVQQRMAREIGCPESSVTVTSLGAGGYRAEGCGQSVVYVCAGSGSAFTCVKDGTPGSGAALQAVQGEQSTSQRAAGTQPGAVQPPIPPPAPVPRAQ
jgi:hypothetical protein